MSKIRLLFGEISVLTFHVNIVGSIAGCKGSRTVNGPKHPENHSVLKNEFLIPNSNYFMDLKRL